MSDEKLVSMMNDTRLIAACDNVIFPMLENFMQRKLEAVCAEFRGGQTNTLISSIAYITALKDILNDLKAKQLAGNKAIQKLHDRQDQQN